MFNQPKNLVLIVLLAIGIRGRATDTESILRSFDRILSDRQTSGRSRHSDGGPDVLYGYFNRALWSDTKQPGDEPLDRVFERMFADVQNGMPRENDEQAPAGGSSSTRNDVLYGIFQKALWDVVGDDAFAGSFERMLEERTGLVSAAKLTSLENDSMYAIFGIQLWTVDSDRPVLFSFERMLEDGAPLNPPERVKGSQDDPLYTHFQHALWSDVGDGRLTVDEQEQVHVVARKAPIKSNCSNCRWGL